MTRRSTDDTADDTAAGAADTAAAADRDLGELNQAAAAAGRAACRPSNGGPPADRRQLADAR